MTATVGLVLGAGAASRWNATKASHPSSRRPLSAATAKYLDDTLNETKAARVRFYLTGATNNALDAWEAVTYWNGVQALADSYVPPAPVRRDPVSRPSSGACGGATNGADAFIGRESGGNPNAVNASSGAYGCYQVLPSTWRSSCSDLGPEQGSSTSTQAACASRLPRSAWSASGPT